MDNRFVSGALSPDPGDRTESGPFRKGEPGIPEGRQLEFQFPAAAKIRIMEMILDRTYGKPEAAVKLSAELENGASSRARLDAIAARIRLEVDG